MGPEPQARQQNIAHVIRHILSASGSEPRWHPDHLDGVLPVCTIRRSVSETCSMVCRNFSRIPRAYWRRLCCAKETKRSQTRQSVFQLACQFAWTQFRVICRRVILGQSHSVLEDHPIMGQETVAIDLESACSMFDGRSFQRFAPFSAKLFGTNGPYVRV